MTALAFVLPGALMTFFAFVPDALPALGVHVSSSFAQKPLEPYGWPEIAARVQAERDALTRDGKPVFMAGTNYRVNSILGFYLHNHPEMVALYLGTRRDQFVVWSHPQDHIGENAILVLSEKDDKAVKLARTVFTSVEEAPSATLYRPGFTGPMKDWRIYRCRNFKGYDIDKYAEGY